MNRFFPPEDRRKLAEQDLADKFVKLAENVLTFVVKT
jgi:hypothetical protein